MKKNSKTEVSPKTRELPSWDLSSNFYTGIDDPKIENDILRVKATVMEISKYEGRIATLLPYEFALLVRLYDGLVETARKLTVFAKLMSDTHLNDPKISSFKVSLSERLDEIIDQPTQFLLTEMARIPQSQQYELLVSPKLRRYAPWLERVFFSSDVDDLAMYIFRKKSATEYQWSKLYDESCARMEFIYKGETYNEAQILALRRSVTNKEDEDAIEQVICNVYKQNAYVIAHCLNAIMKNEDVDAKLFGYYNAENESFASNMVLREDLLLLISAVTDAFIPMSRRFYALLSKLHQSPKCHSAGNPIIVPEKEYTWDECKKIVLNAYKAFSPLYAIYAESVIDNDLIDVGTKKGKKSGAYCIGGDAPYIFLNFTGKEGDINTFAHELGHAVHHLLSSTQGYLNDNTPISLAEVASEFAENLVYEKQLAAAKTNTEKLHLLIERASDQIGSIHRQVAIYNFEKRVHAERQKGSVTVERLNHIWAEEYERYTGKKLEGDSQYIWMGIAHLFNSPFYVYCYAFAGCLANNLIKVWHDNELDNIELSDFQSRYLEMLSNTGVEPYRDLLEAFELDVDNPKFWRDGLEAVEKNIDEIEKLAKEEGLL